MVAVFAALPFAASAQSDKVVETIRESPLSKDDMWHNLRRWVSLTFDRSDVIDMEDAGRGTMIVKWACPVKVASEFIDPVVSATYQIDVREGRYRVRCLAPKISFRIVRPAGFDEYMPLNSADINLITVWRSVSTAEASTGLSTRLMTIFSTPMSSISTAHPNIAVTVTARKARSLTSGRPPNITGKSFMTSGKALTISTPRC